MQADGADMAFIEVLMDLEKILFMIEGCGQGLPEWRERFAGDHGDRAVDLCDHADRRFALGATTGFFVRLHNVFNL